MDEEDIAVVERDDVIADDDRTGLQFRLGYFAQLHHLGPAEAVELDCFHLFHMLAVGLFM